MYNGLSLDQAPPISVVLRFFFAVPLFGILLSTLIFFNPHEVLTPTHPLSLAAIHLMFLGVITMAMIGALFQMQSVLGGRPIPAVLGNAFLIHLFLLIGVLSLSGGFVFGVSELFVMASVFLGGSILYAINLILPLLFGAAVHDTLRGMRLALISLAMTAILGIIMATSYANASFSPSHESIRTAHYSLGLIGWIGTLIVAVAFQVVEMFYVTTPYSLWCKRNAFRIIAVSLFFKILWLFLGWPFVWVFDLVIGALLIGFAVTSAKRLKERKRRVSDVSIWFWILGIAFLAVSVIAFVLFEWLRYPPLESISLISFALFALAIILGMMGKIVPFLIWFHLNSAGYMDAPIMSNIIPQIRAKWVFYLYVLSSLSVLSGVFVSELLVLGALSSGVMFSLLLFNLIRAFTLYGYTLTHGTRFEQM
jgi:hypothetical protein